MGDAPVILIVVYEVYASAIVQVILIVIDIEASDTYG